MKHLSILVPFEQTNLSTIACIVGSSQVFTEANNYYERNGKKALFRIDLVAANKGSLLNNGLLSVHHSATIRQIMKTDLVITPASLIRSYDSATPRNQRLINWVAARYRAGAQVASMCAGSFMLASTGLLEGRTCSTHWALADQFRSLFPGVRLQTDQLITDENGLYTNGGAYSFLHLLMYLVEKYYDRPTAIHCAKYFQVDLNRSRQAEFAIFNGHKKHNDDEVLDAQEFIEANYQEKISIENLCSRFGIGRRNFDRRFIKATGLTPLDYLQRVKIERAKKMFENSRKSVSEVMYETGYNDTKAFREVFARITGMSPIAYKGKYNKG